MRILIVTHYYPPEIGAPQARLSEMGRAWAAGGDDVTVLTAFPNHPTGIIHPGYEGRLRLREDVDGVHVVRTWVYATPNERIIRKTLGHLSFMVSSVLLGLRWTGKADVVVVSSPTFFSIASGWFIARVKRARFVVEIRDLWPAFLVELDVLRNPTIIKILETFELASYRAADAVITVTQGLRDGITSRGISPEKVHVIRNGVDLSRFALANGDVGAVRKQLGASDRETLVLYAGAHGISHALGSIADAAALLRDEPVHFAFVGEGAAKAQLAARVTALGLDNVTMLPGVPREQMGQILAAADVCLVPLRDVPLFEGAIPSKVFEYMAASKAVVGSLRGECATILREAGELVVEPEDPVALADAIRDLSRDPDRRRAMGVKALQFVQEHFDRNALARQYHAILEAIRTAD